MKQELKKWIEKAEDDFDTASYNLRGKKTDAAIFYSQQAAEKALKAFYIKKYKKLLKIHDLVLLGKAVGLPNDLLNEVKELTFAYIYSRYPDVKEESNLKDKVVNFLNVSKRIIRWVKKNI